MRAVDRNGVEIPKSLLPGGAGSSELERARTHVTDANPKKKAFTYSAYKGADVKLALEALFHGKCAYCETRYGVTAPVDVEHHRPKGAVAEEPRHGGYWWVAMAWENLLPSCIDCNRQRNQVIVEASSSLEQLAVQSRPATAAAGKKDSFPLAAGSTRAVAEASDFAPESALLIDPCCDDPEAHMAFNFDSSRPLGLVVPAGDDEAAKQRGAVSIQVYGLNRLRLVQERTEVLRRLEFLAGLVTDLAASIADLEEPATAKRIRGTAAEGVSSRLRLLRDRTLAEMKGMGADDAPYAAMVKAWLREFRRRVEAAGQYSATGRIARE